MEVKRSTLWCDLLLELNPSDVHTPELGWFIWWFRHHTSPEGQLAQEILSNLRIPALEKQGCSQIEAGWNWAECAQWFLPHLLVGYTTALQEWRQQGSKESLGVSLEQIFPYGFLLERWQGKAVLSFTGVV